MHGAHVVCVGMLVNLMLPNNACIQRPRRACNVSWVKDATKCIHYITYTVGRAQRYMDVDWGLTLNVKMDSAAPEPSRTPSSHGTSAPDKAAGRARRKLKKDPSADGADAPNTAHT